MSQRVVVPDTVYEQAIELKAKRDMSSIKEAIRYMCQDGGYDV